MEFYIKKTVLIFFLAICALVVFIIFDATYLTDRKIRKAEEFSLEIYDAMFYEYDLHSKDVVDNKKFVFSDITKLVKDRLVKNLYRSGGEESFYVKGESCSFYVYKFKYKNSSSDYEWPLIFFECLKIDGSSADNILSSELRDVVRTIGDDLLIKKIPFSKYNLYIIDDTKYYGFLEIRESFKKDFRLEDVMKRNPEYRYFK